MKKVFDPIFGQVRMVSDSCHQFCYLKFLINKVAKKFINFQEKLVQHLEDEFITYFKMISNEHLYRYSIRIRSATNYISHQVFGHVNSSASAYKFQRVETILRIKSKQIFLEHLFEFYSLSISETREQQFFRKLPPVSAIFVHAIVMVLLISLKVPNSVFLQKEYSFFLNSIFFNLEMLLKFSECFIIFAPF